MTTTDPQRPHVFWYGDDPNVLHLTPQDPRDAMLAELTTALRRIRTLASDTPLLRTIDPDVMLTVISAMANDALAGATVDEELTI